MDERAEPVGGAGAVVARRRQGRLDVAAGQQQRGAYEGGAETGHDCVMDSVVAALDGKGPAVATENVRR